MFMIVPNYISDEINAKLDAELEKHPEAAPDREIFYDHLLAHFNEHGVIPTFSLQRNAE